MTPVIAARGLSYIYPDGQAALRDVSFSLEADETLAIIGPNGAGKSTLLLHLIGLLAPSRGTVEILGLPVNGGNLRKVRRAAGLVFQDPDDQLFCPTVFDDVAFGPLNLGYPEREVRAAVAASLSQVGMSGNEARLPQHLSQGEKKRVALACVLAASPAVLLLDEPTASLDLGGKWELVSLLKRLPGPKIIVTHDLELAGELAGRIIVMDKGEVVLTGEAHKILADRDFLAAHCLAKPQEKICL